MSRLTGTDAYGLMEAYQAVYAPQELTEEQVWEEVETWLGKRCMSLILLMNLIQLLMD
jgi:hypothetical protein